MKFQEWIAAQGGCEGVAKRFKVTRQTVYYWATGKSSPTAKLMYELVRDSRGLLTYEEIIAARLFPSKKGVRR